MNNRLILAVAIIFIFLLGVMGNSPVSAQVPDNTQDYSADRVLVKFLPGTPEITRENMFQRQGDKALDIITGIDVQVIGVAKNKVQEKIKAYRAESNVIFAEPDYIAHAVFTPNDTYFPNQWGLTKVGAPGAWDTTKGLSTVKIAICDTGIDVNHEDLAAKIVASKNFTWSGTVDDQYGHGTHVAGIAASITNNGTGVAGVGFNSSLMNAKVLDDNGSGYYSWIASGITWAADNGAKVINLSLGGSSSSTTLKDAIDYAWGKGSVVVAAAGNSNATIPLYPAYYDNSIAVAATDQNDTKASFSNYGSWVDISAPGTQIFSTLPNHSNKIGTMNYGYLNGTSMSTPFVAGLAALVWATGYGMSNTSVRNRMESTADQAGSMWSQYGIKRINAYKAVGSAAPPSPDDTTGPITSGVAASPNPTGGVALVTLKATISDVNTGGSNISGAEYFIDDIGSNGSGTPMNAADGAFNSTTEMVTRTFDVSALSPGDHTLYVHGRDAKEGTKGNWGGTTSTKLSITEKPAGNTNDMFVWSIDYRTIKWGTWLGWLFIDITIRHDSNANGIADVTDEVVKEATVDITLTNQTTGQVLTGKGARTGSNGLATYYVTGPQKGSHITEVTALTHATYSWNRALDKENPSEPYTVTIDSIPSSGKTVDFFKR